MLRGGRSADVSERNKGGKTRQTFVWGFRLSIVDNRFSLVLTPQNGLLGAFAWPVRMWRTSQDGDAAVPAAADSACKRGEWHLRRNRVASGIIVMIMMMSRAVNRFQWGKAFSLSPPGNRHSLHGAGRCITSLFDRGLGYVTSVFRHVPADDVEPPLSSRQPSYYHAHWSPAVCCPPHPHRDGSAAGEPSADSAYQGGTSRCGTVGP